MAKLDDLKQKIDRQTERIKKAEQERQTLLGQTIYIGTLGLLLVLPVVGGAYLGHWLDSMMAGYSIRWTMSLILLGVFVGAFNVYLFIRE
ncbi:AtpZ/AtpI family protein [Photobacterium sp. MCCC 1A19761]|uniref:AtpZ/AtpI family protein n=1 Tax=Photobacterium sp. MCCC 1A19761 TaxID=3115000 RepID=UPI00307E38A0